MEKFISHNSKLLKKLRAYTKINRKIFSPLSPYSYLLNLRKMSPIENCNLFIEISQAVFLGHIPHDFRAKLKIHRNLLCYNGGNQIFEDKRPQT